MLRDLESVVSLGQGWSLKGQDGGGGHCFGRLGSGKGTALFWSSWPAGIVFRCCGESREQVTTTQVRARPAPRMASSRLLSSTGTRLSAGRFQGPLYAPAGLKRTQLSHLRLEPGKGPAAMIFTEPTLLYHRRIPGWGQPDRQFRRGNGSTEARGTTRRAGSDGTPINHDPAAPSHGVTAPSYIARAECAAAARSQVISQPEQRQSDGC